MLKRFRKWSNFALALAVACGAAACDDEDPVSPQLPAAPTGLTATRVSDGVEVRWEAVSGAQSYTLERQTGGAGAFAQVAAGLTATSYKDPVVEPGTYSYRVMAVAGTQRSLPADPVTLVVSAPGEARATLAGTIGAGQTRTLSADTVYTMQGTVVVDSAGTLVIPAGTTILGDANVRPTALLVRIGGTIRAEGTAERPIVFTSSKPAGQRARGDWGGIVIAGRSNCNFPAPCQAEGIQTRYGGSRADDSSGRLSYVRIEYAGFEVSPGNELNGLTLAGVGSGTQIDHVQVHYGSDDGIEWFGGTVNVKYALVTGSDDDSFDYSSGWTGKGQFWIAQQSENAGDKGFEVDGNESNFTATPVTDPQIYNVTLVGRGGSSGGNDAVQLRRGVRGGVYNAILLGWGGSALDVDDQATADHCSGETRLMDNVIWFGTTSQFDDDSDAFEAACAGSAWRNVDPGLGDAGNRTAPNFVPAAGSPALTGARAVPAGDAFFTAVDYLGAVAPSGTPWYQGWTTFAAN